MINYAAPFYPLVRLIEQEIAANPGKYDAKYNQPYRRHARAARLKENDA